MKHLPRRNKVAIEVVDKEAAGCNFEDLSHLVSGQRGRKVYEYGDIDAGIWTCGVSVGLIHDIPSCDDLVRRIEQDAEEQIQHLTSLVTQKK